MHNDENSVERLKTENTHSTKRYSVLIVYAVYVEGASKVLMLTSVKHCKSIYMIYLN